MPLPDKMIFPATWAGYLGLHEIILYIVIVLLVVAFGGGPALKVLFNAILKVFGHGGSETVVNVELPGGSMAKVPKECEGCGLAVDPSKCAMHQAEHERSLRNETQITDLWKTYGEMRKEMSAGFKEVQTSINETQKTILGALAGDRIGFAKPGLGGGD